MLHCLIVNWDLCRYLQLQHELEDAKKLEGRITIDYGDRRVWLPLITGTRGWLYVWMLLAKNEVLTRNMPLSTTPLTATEEWSRVGTTIPVIGRSVCSKSLCRVPRRL